MQKRKVYTEAEKVKIVEQIQMGESLTYISRQIGIPVQTLYNWKRKIKKNDKPEPITICEPRGLNSDELKPRQWRVHHFVTWVLLSIIIYKIW